MATGSETTEDERQCEQIASEALITLSMEAELRQVCEGLKATDLVQRKARGLWKDIQLIMADDKDGFKPWFACCLYMASIDASMPYGLNDPMLQGGHMDGPSFTVTDLLKAANVKITVFFQKMRIIRESYDLSETVQHHLIGLEKRYCIVSAIFHKFERLFKEVFREEVHIVVHEDSQVLKALNPEGYEFNKRLCWALFLLAKGAYLGGSQELVLAFHFLVCCVEFVMSYAPAFQLLPPFESLRMGNNNHAQEQVLLKKLCDHCSTSFDEVNRVKKTYTEPFIHSLRSQQGLLEMDHLMELYSGVYYNEKDIDEMLFLQHDAHLLPVYSQSRRSPTKTPNPEVHMTPIRSALSTVQQLQKILSNGSDQPSEGLLVYFKSCAKRPDDGIAKRVVDFQSIFTQKFVEVAGEKHKSIAEQRFKMSLRLYYRVMESLLNSEEERLSQKDFSTLLNKDVFHRSLLACSVEIVMTAYGVSWNTTAQAMDSAESDFAFPWILEAFQLKAYDFYKVLESFIRAESKLTKDIIRHLQGVENRILESIAWEEDSPLYDALSSCEITQMAIPSPSPIDNNNVHGASAAELYLSPMCHRQVTPRTSPNQMAEGLGSLTSPRKIQEQNGSPSQNNSPRGTGPPKTPPPPRRSQSLNLFFNKVCRLGYHRLKALCDLLDVPKDLQHKVWTCFEYCITHKPYLMKNRHLDQIMMCSIYAMCKVVEKEIKFKTIVNMYKNLPNASQEVYKAAVISGTTFDTIIGFYNRVFMLTMKAYILQFSGAKSMNPSLSPMPKSVSSPLLSSPSYSIPGRKNFTISPMKQSPFKTPLSPNQMTPTTRALYSFGDLPGSSEQLQQINKRMSAIKRSAVSSGIRSSKRLKFDQCEDPLPSNPAPPSVIIIKRTPTGTGISQGRSLQQHLNGQNGQSLTNEQNSGNTGVTNTTREGSTQINGRGSN